VLAAERILNFGLRARGRKPVGALPAHLAAEARAFSLQEVVHRRAAQRPRGIGFAVRPRHREMHAARLRDAADQEQLVAIPPRRTGKSRSTPAIFPVTM